MAQKGLAVNQLTTPADRFISRGLEMLAVTNTDLRNKPQVNNQLKKASRSARKKVENQLTRDSHVLFGTLLKSMWYSLGRDNFQLQEE